MWIIVWGKIRQKRLTRSLGTRGTSCDWALTSCGPIDYGGKSKSARSRPTDLRCDVGEFGDVDDQVPENDQTATEAEQQLGTHVDKIRSGAQRLNAEITKKELWKKSERHAKERLTRCYAWVARLFMKSFARRRQQSCHLSELRSLQLEPTKSIPKRKRKLCWSYEIARTLTSFRE